MAVNLDEVWSRRQQIAWWTQHGRTYGDSLRRTYFNKWRSRLLANIKREWLSVRGGIWISMEKCSMGSYHYSWPSQLGSLASTGESISTEQLVRLLPESAQASADITRITIQYIGYTNPDAWLRDYLSRHYRLHFEP